MGSFVLTGRVLFPDGVLRPGRLVIENELIASVRELANDQEEIISPGLIDLQINGAFGSDFTANPETIRRVALQLPRTGVTAFLPTIISSPLETYAPVYEEIRSDRGRSGGARTLGLHFEGPYLSPLRAGAHNPQYLRSPADPKGDSLLPEGMDSGALRLMTLAPEVDNSLEAIRDLCAAGVVVSLGHSAATYETALAALNAGARYGTHLFNAMPPLHHREPGIAGALLADERVTVGLIADGVHLHSSLFRWLVKAKGPRRITLVTDAMAAAGLGAGEYKLGDRVVFVDKNSARLEDGTLAGSILTLDQAVRNLVAWGACSQADALTMASTTPACLLGLEHLGRIAEGCTADLIVLDRELRVRQTIINGQTVSQQ